jgi:hypothetical protein
MNCPNQPEITDIPGANSKDMAARLTKLLGTVKLVRLVELLEDVIEETGYGDVKIVVAEGKVQMLKAEHSYK